LLKAKISQKLVNNLSVMNWADFIEAGKRSNTKIYLDTDTEETASNTIYRRYHRHPERRRTKPQERVCEHNSKHDVYSGAAHDGEGAMLVVLPLFHVFAMTTAMLYGVCTAAKLFCIHALMR
jgi:hypothetical protein